MGQTPNGDSGKFLACDANPFVSYIYKDVDANMATDTASFPLTGQASLAVSAKGYKCRLSPIAVVLVQEG